MCVVVEGSGLRNVAAKNKLSFFSAFCWKMFQLSEFSNPFPQAATVGNRQLWTRTGPAVTVSAGFSY